MEKKDKEGSNEKEGQKATTEAAATSGAAASSIVAEGAAASFVQPSVGTWLQARSKFVVQDTGVPVTEPEEKCALACEPEDKFVPIVEPEEKCSYACNPEEKCVPSPAKEVEDFHTFIIESEKQWCHLPSVGTWLQRPTPVVRAALVASAAKIAEAS